MPLRPRDQLQVIRVRQEAHPRLRGSLSTGKSLVEGSTGNDIMR